MASAEPGLMTQGEFVGRVVGLPWVRWRSDWSGADCYGLVLLYLREVLGIDLGAVPQEAIADGFPLAGGWVECEASAGGLLCFMSWRDGAPTHCGLMLRGDLVLHSEGSPERQGSARVSRLSAVERLHGPARFYRIAPC